MQIESSEQSYQAGIETLFNGHLSTTAMPKGSAQREGTQDIIVDYVSDYFGFLINILGVRREDASLAQLACLPAIVSYIEFKRRDKPDEEEKDRLLSRHDVKGLLAFDQILDYVGQDLSIRDRLKPIPGHLTAENALFFQQHWKWHILEVSKEVQKLYKNEIKQCAKRSDNEEKIRKILESKRPLKILHDMRRAAQKAVDRAPTRFARAVALRDLFIIVVMMTLCAFRPKTVCHLNYEINGGSCFRHTDADGTDGWWIFAKKEVFKNFDRPIMQRNYMRMIQNIDGLYNYVEEYLFEGRGILLGQATSNCLVVNTEANPRFSPKSYGAHVHYLTRRLLTVDLAGQWSGIDSLTCTQVRKILATGLNQKYKDPEYTEVKNALMNEVPYIYSHDAARNRSRSTEAIVMETANQ